MRKQNSHSGFTLAEVLITLGVIGIVAAMTIPSLLNKYYEKRTVSQLRETQSIISQALRIAEDEYGDIEGMVNNSMTNSERVQAVLENLKPFLKLSLDCGIDDPNNHCVPNVAYLERNGKPRVNYTNSDCYKVRLLNGASIFFIYEQGQTLHVYIDTNGLYKPNTWGKDLFMFEYSKNSLIPVGASNSSYPYETHCKLKNSSGVGCAYYVLTQNNMNYLH